MNIGKKFLLVGEFSGFYANLKKGFQLLGHDVTMMAKQDGWKKISGADITIYSFFPSILGKISEELQYILRAFFLKKYDLIFIVNPNIGINHISGLFGWILKKKGKTIILSACGTDLEYMNYGISKQLDYWAFKGCEDEFILNVKTHKDIETASNLIIPTFYDFAEPWRNSLSKDKVLKTIPLPINTRSIEVFFPNKKDKVTFFHGLNSVCKKGTKYIREALENVLRKYPNDIEVIIDGHMAQEKYLNLMKKADVVIDQCKVYSYGSMNSLYALSMGKVLMASLKEECILEYNLKDENLVGIIDIEPCVAQIENKIEFILANKDYLNQWGKINRAFVERIHDSQIIAKKYIELLENNIKI